MFYLIYSFTLLLFIFLSRPVLGRGGGFPQTEWLLRTQALSGYNGETNNLGRCFEITKGILFFITKYYEKVAIASNQFFL